MWANRLAILLLSVCLAVCARGCPGGCTCTMVGRGRKKGGASDLAASAPIGRRVICHSGDALTSVEQVSPSTLEMDTIVLDLSGNAIKVIRSGSFMGLSMLQKLDLSDNQITQIEAGAFLGLDNLLRLNLSNNQLGRLGKGIFDGIPKLERLSLSGNQIKGLPQGIFDNLPVLKKVDFQSDFLVCDCNLQWIVKWLKMTSVQLRSTTVCAVPMQLKEKTVKSLKKKDYHCNWPVELPLFELTPATSQVVFQGDKLPFVCRASVIDSSTRMVWIREGKPVLTNKTVGIFVHTRYSPDRTVMINSLVLEKLALKDSGIWQCRVQTMRGNVSKTVNIIVISVDTLYCRKKVTITNKGTFTWPKTVAGVTAVALCETGRASGYTAPSSPHAYHKCSSQGSWEDLTVDQCQYESEVTRVLEQYAKFDLQNMTKLVSRANQLKGYLKTAKTITDKMDVIFTSRIVERLGRLVSDYERLSDIILHIVSVMMSADDSLLLEAQKEEAACSRMVRAVESIPKQLLKEKKVISRYVDNIALEAHNVNSETFLGITCMSFAPQTRRGVYNEDSFSCTSHGNHSDEVPEGKSLEASVHIPADIFKSVRCLPVCSSSNNFKLQFITYKNAKLFPVLGPASLDMVVKSSVISARIVDVTVENTTSPIEVKLLTREAGTDHTAVYWDFEAQKGLGQWVTRGCTLQSLDGDISLIRCSQLKSFAVMQSWQTASSSLPSWLWGCFNMGAAIYAGTSVLAICVMATLITYILYHGSIKMPWKSRHAVANLCIGLLLLCVTYTLGIHTEQPRLACHVIGIIIHYLSLVTLAWITILAFTIYKKFSKAVQPPPLPEDLPDNPPLPKPILGFYLVGWGVAMLVCGITAAISLEHYITGNQYCFLSTEARMFALYAPAAFLASICVIFFLSMCCLLREGPRDPADLVDDVSDVHLAGNELDSVTPTTNLTNTTALSSSVMDLEYRPVVQLYGVVMVLFLYLFTWTCGAFVVALPFGSLLPHREMVYNYLYGFTSAALGIFILVFYCLAREDARGCWRNSCCKKDVQPEAVAMATNPSNGHVMRHRGSIELSISGKSSNSTNRAPSVLCAPKVTNISSQAGGTATDLSLGSYQECATFYNPRQNGIAKKYWQKNRLRSQLHKGLNMGSGPLMHGPGDGSRTFSDDSFKRRSYGNGSDANTHLSIEIELQPKNSNFCPPGDSADRVYSGLAAPGKYPELHPAVAAQYLPRGCCQLTPVPGTRSPTAGVYTPEVPTNSYPVLPSHITAMYSLPRSTLHDDQPLQVNEFMQRNGSVPRLRDFDGQSHVSSQVTSTHELGAASVNSDARTGDTINSPGDERRPQCISTKEPPPKIAPKPPLSSFMDQLQQRIPPSNDSRSSTPREQSHFHKPDSNAELKVLPSVEKPQPHSLRPEKHPKPSLKSPPRTLDPDHPPCVPVVKASYAAVCQLSREASLERLLPTSQQAASQDPDESENLLPKGGYAEGHSDPGNEDELSGEENGDDIWVPRKEKSKHETSV